MIFFPAPMQQHCQNLRTRHTWYKRHHIRSAGEFRYKSRARSQSSRYWLSTT